MWVGLRKTVVIRSCPDRCNVVERTRAIIADNLRKAKPIQQNIQKEEREWLRSLRLNKDITILPGNKGSATVILDTKAYEAKAKDLLCKTPFKKLTRDQTLKNERKVNNALKALAEQGLIKKDM